MSNILTLAQVVKQTRDRQAALQPYDHTDDRGTYRYFWDEARGPHMVRLTADRTYDLTPRAESQLLQDLGVPVVFFRSLPANIQFAVANWKVQNSNYERESLLRTVRGNTVRAFLSERYTSFDDVDVIPLVADILGDEDVLIEALDFHDDATHMRITFPGQTTELKKGDIVRTGIHITNSEVGLRAVHVDALVHRLVCTNGLVRAESNGKTTLRHFGNRDRLKDDIARAITDAKDNTRHLVSQFRDSINQHLSDPRQFLRDHAKDMTLTKEQLNAALDAFSFDPDGSLFGAVNAVTRAAQAEATYEGRYQMERIGSQMLQRYLDGASR